MCTRSIDQCMKPAVKMLHQIFRCKQRTIRPQESEKLPSLLFPALVVEFALPFEIRTVRRFIATELESIDSPIMLCEPCPTTTEVAFTLQDSFLVVSSWFINVCVF